MNGVLNIFKPKNMTSHDVVSFLRKKLNTKRIGHTGTLDPMATGVLIICIGKATRISEYLIDLDKKYIGELSLGYATDTQDMYGNVIKNSDKIVSSEEIEGVFKSYIGPIKQVPPMYSAVRHKGKKLYELARQGIEVERKARDAYIYDLKPINNMDNKKILFSCKCSKGTYIRTLCNDIGQDLETYAYMSSLIRVEVGDFQINSSYSLDFLSGMTKSEICDLLIPIEKSLNNFKFIIIDSSKYKKLVNGMPIPLGDHDINNIKDKEYVKVFSKDTFIGIGIVTDSILKMKKVLA